MCTKGTKGKSFGAYHRVSQANGREIEDECTLTDKDAWAKIDGWATASGVTIVERYLDWDRTGSKLERPEQDRMLADLKAGGIEGIAVAKTDRLSRAKTGDALRLVGEIQEIKPGSLALLDLGVDPTTPTGEMMLTILLAFAHMQWRQFKEAWSSAQTQAIKRGLWLGPEPLGYRHTVLSARKNGKSLYGPLEVDPVYGPIVREAFKIAAGSGLHAATDYLSEQVPDRSWDTSEGRRILRSRAYLGEAVHGKLVNREAHPPLTTVEIFEAAQSEPKLRRRSGDYPLSGIARCAGCGGPMVGHLQSVKGRGPYRRLRCTNKWNGGNHPCGAPASISADGLEAHLREFLRPYLDTKAFREAFVPHGLEEAGEALEQAESDLRRWAGDDRTRDLIGDVAFYEGLEDRSQTVERAREDYQSVASQAATVKRLPVSNDLDDPEGFAIAMQMALPDGVTIRSGRGTVEERIVDYGWKRAVKERLQKAA